MKILIYTHSLYPNVGGVEDVADALASGLVELGQSVAVVTPIACSQERQTNYKVVRRPSFAQLVQLVRESDLIHANGSAMQLFPLSFVFRKPFTWTHHGYQLQCIDGAGWTDGAPAPMEPSSSFWHHVKQSGVLVAANGGLKLLIRRLVARLVSANIASSAHVASRQPLPRQTVINNPYDRKLFSVAGLNEADNQLKAASATFTFIGRLISEKGVETLLRALAAYHESQKRESGSMTATLKVIGEGPEKEGLVKLARDLKLDEHVVWKGSQTAPQLSEELKTTGICVVPSIWEEPSALTVMALMSAGKPLIVSQNGWLSECAGEACLTFPNGDFEQLAECMRKLDNNKQLQSKLIENGFSRIQRFHPEASLQAYLSLFREVTGQASSAPAVSSL